MSSPLSVEMLRQAPAVDAPFPPSSPHMVWKAAGVEAGQSPHMLWNLASGDGVGGPATHCRRGLAEGDARMGAETRRGS
eukprot:1053623-Rhodomonas_salina.1